MLQYRLQLQLGKKKLKYLSISALPHSSLGSCWTLAVTATAFGITGRLENG